MNEQVCTSYGCIQEEIYKPKDAANITYGPIDSLENFWYSLDDLGKGALISSGVLVAIFLATMILK